MWMLVFDRWWKEKPILVPKRQLVSFMIYTMIGLPVLSVLRYDDEFIYTK